MKKMVLLSLLFLFVVGACWANYSDVRSSIIELKVGKEGGAGVVIEDDGDYLYILTCEHAFQKKKTMAVQIRDIDWNKTVIDIYPENVRKHPLIDLAIIRVERPIGVYKVAPMAVSEPVIGDPVSIIGHPMNFHYTLSEGIVSNYPIKRIRKNQDVELMMISAPAIGGNSGGPVFNDRWEVVGIVSGIMYYEEGWLLGSDTEFVHFMTFIVPLSQIEEFLDDVEW